MALARSISASRGAEDLELVREGLRNAGAGQLLAARAEQKRKKWERVRALYDLGWLGDTDTLPVLYRAVADRDDDVAWAAIVALGGMDSAVADQVLLELLDDERFAASRIAEVLDTSGHWRPVSVLHERVTASTPRSLFWIAYLLGRSGDPAALAPLLELKDHPSADVRAAVAEAFGRLGEQSAVEPLLEMARDEVWFVRLHASRSLGDLAARNSIPVLEAATQDPSWWVRNSAFDSLRRLQGSV
jgi:HEAT repeat protein